MAISRGVGPIYGQDTTGSATSISVTLNSCTAGRMVVWIAEWQEVGTVAAITTATVGGTSATVISGSKVTGPGGLNNCHKQIGFLNNLASGGNKVVTVNFDNPVYVSLGAMEYQGQDTTTQPDASNTATGSFTNPSLSMTTIVDNALIVAGVSDNSAGPTAGVVYTLWGTRPNNAANDEDEDRMDAGAAASKTVDFVTGAGGQWYMSAASFKPSGGAGTTPKTFTGTDSLAGGELL